MSWRVNQIWLSHLYLFWHPGGKPNALSRQPDYMAENKIFWPTLFLQPEQADTTEIEIGTFKQLKDEDLGQAIWEA